MRKILLYMSILCMLTMVSFVPAIAVNTPSSAVAISSMTLETDAFAAVTVTDGKMANSAVQYKGNTEGNTSVQFSGNQALSSSPLTPSMTSGGNSTITSATAITNGLTTAMATSDATINYAGNYSGETAKSAATVLKYLIPASGINTENTSIVATRVLKVLIDQASSSSIATTDVVEAMTIPVPALSVLKFPIPAGVNTDTSFLVESAKTISQTADRAPVTTLKYLINGNVEKTGAVTMTGDNAQMLTPGQISFSNNTSEYPVSAYVAQMTDSAMNQEGTADATDLVAGANDILLAATWTAENIGTNLNRTADNSLMKTDTDAMTTRPAIPIHMDITMGIAAAGLSMNAMA